MEFEVVWNRFRRWIVIPQGRIPHAACRAIAACDLFRILIERETRHQTTLLTQPLYALSPPAAQVG